MKIITGDVRFQCIGEKQLVVLSWGFCLCKFFPVRKVIGSFSSEDSTIGFRLPELPPGTNTTLGLVTDGILQFDEGSLRGVAAMIVLIAFTLVMGDVEGAALLHPNVTKCVKSLMTIPCKRKAKYLIFCAVIAITHF